MKLYQKADYPLAGIRRYLELGPVVLVSSEWKGERNIMTMGWHMMLGFSPALFGCYIWPGNHSYGMLRESRQCVINLPTAELLDETVGIGNSSGVEFEHPGECLCRLADRTVQKPSALPMRYVTAR